MPRFCNSAPRKKLPPPTTAPATSSYAFAKAVARLAAHHGLRTTVSGSGLADLEPDEPRHIDAGLAEHLLDGLLVVGHRGLLQQDEVLEEGVRATLDDLGQGRFRLALLARGLLGDAALGLDDVGRHLLAGEEL